MTTNITAENYVFKFGKYKNMLLTDVANFKSVDKKGNMKKTGLQYLKWLVQQDWFKNTDIINEVINKFDVEEDNNDDNKIVEEKPKIDKRKKEKKINKVTISSNKEDSKVVFN